MMATTISNDSLHYIELSENPIRFDCATQLTNVFFDDTNKQIFAVRSGGTTGVVVKGPTIDDVISFCMDNKGTISSIKFSLDNSLLAIQRTENSVEFIPFYDKQPNFNELLIYQAKNIFIYGFVWICLKELALISNNGVEIFTINTEKKQIKSVKTLNLTVKWFAWCAEGNFAVLATNNGMILHPIILKSKTITRLPKLELEVTKEVPERDVTLAQIYGILAVLLLHQSSNRLVEVFIYLLNGPGLAPKKAHVLRLGLNGRFAMNVIDNLIAVHHQASATTLLFDIALKEETDTEGVIYHTPITQGRSIKPFLLKLPSLSLDQETMNCKLYSTKWVLFQPNIVIDAEIGYMWYLSLKLEPMTELVADRVKLVEFLSQRTNGKIILINVLRLLLDNQYNGTFLPIIENVFNKLNGINAIWNVEDSSENPSNVKNFSKQEIAPKVFIDQGEMLSNVFNLINHKNHLEKILLLYLYSLIKYNITAKEELSKLIACELIKNKNFQTLQKLVECSLLYESKPLACYILSHSKLSQRITQIAMDMLKKLQANEIMLEVLLSQNRIIEALRMVKKLPNSDNISARKFLDSAKKSGDDLLFYSVFMYFTQRNIRIRGTPEFQKNELCFEYVQHFDKTFGAEKT